MTQSTPPPAASPRDRLRRFGQADAFTSPWTVRTRLKAVLWSIAWATLCRWTPKPFVRWRVAVLRLFGATIEGRPFVASSARIKMPWLLTLEHRACLGPHCEAYNLARLTLKARCTVAQHVYLCGGTHDFADPGLPLVVGEIVLGADSFIGARAFVMPGVVVGDGAVIGACAVVTRDAPPWTICAGHPCAPIKPRTFPGAPTAADRIQ